MKGYEYEKGKWITLIDADFEMVEIESTKTIEITDFVEVEQINAKFFYKPYFLEALKGGEKAYGLLHRALVETERVGIAKVAKITDKAPRAPVPDLLAILQESIAKNADVRKVKSTKSRGRSSTALVTTKRRAAL